MPCSCRITGTVYKDKHRIALGFVILQTLRNAQKSMCVSSDTSGQAGQVPLTISHLRPYYLSTHKSVLQQTPRPYGSDRRIFIEFPFSMPSSIMFLKCVIISILTKSL